MIVSRFWWDVGQLPLECDKETYPWAREIVVRVFEETEVMCTQRPGTEHP